MPKPSSKKAVDREDAAYEYRGYKLQDHKTVGQPESYKLGSMSMGNDGSKSAEYPPESMKKKPGAMPSGKK